MPPPPDTAAPASEVRAAIRDVLTANHDYRGLDDHTRREIARGLVKISAAAMALDAAAGVPSPATRAPLARAQSAGSEFSGVAAQRVAGTTKDILNAVSFPRFVTELISGVFKALVDSNQQQLHSYVELIQNVAASTEGFADANVGLSGARQWLAERFPGSFTVQGEEDPFGDSGQPRDAEEQAERDQETQLRLRPGASMPSEGALRTALGLGAQDAVPGDPETLAAVARGALARNRQQMLATLVMLGLQRIVIDSGRLHASMRFHIDTRSAAAEDRGSSFDFRNTTNVAGSFGFGPWGASANMTNTIGYVSTDKVQTTEEMNTDLDLNSSVELVFKTDYLPLERLAGGEQLKRIQVNTLNPEAEVKAATEERTARQQRIADSDKTRRTSLDASLAPPPPPPPAPKPGEPGTAEAATKARTDAKTDAKKTDASAKTSGNQSEKKPDQAGAAKTEEPAAPKAGTSKSPADTGKTPTTAANTSTSKKPDTVAKTKSLSLDDEPRATESDPPAAPRTDVIFVPTPDEAIDEMLSLACIQPGELLFDLGCGDGRILVAAVEKYGCRAIGFDIDPRRVEEARQRVAQHHLEHLVRVEQHDLFQLDLSQADVVTLYLLPSLNARLVPQLDGMRPGARIVSHDFDIAGVIPDRAVQVFLPRLNLHKTFYLWTAPLKKAEQPVPHQWANSCVIANETARRGLDANIA